MTGTTGEIENLYSYDGFGNILEKKEDITNRILYTGQQYDQEMGQYYLRARYYNPVIGRFTQEDTYRGDGLNLYAYCGNNPVMYYDPSGYGANANASPSCTNSDSQNPAAQKPVDGVGEGGSKTYYFRGTTEGFEGNPELQQLGITPTSTDPSVATVFAINGEQYGDGILYIASSSDLEGVSFDNLNVLSSYEKEITFNILPSEFAERASISVSAQDARAILKAMGYDIPSRVSNGEMSSILMNLPSLSSNEINQFVKIAGGT